MARLLFTLKPFERHGFVVKHAQVHRFFFQHFAAGGNQEFSAHENMRLQLWVHSVVDGALGGLAGFHGVSHEVGRPVHRSNINKVWNLHGGKKKRKKKKRHPIDSGLDIFGHCGESASCFDGRQYIRIVIPK